jgi:hypothetical protein
MVDVGDLKSSDFGRAGSSPVTHTRIPGLHFVWFRGEEYWAAVKIWGRPSFIHMGWDLRAQRDIADGDVVIFARGDYNQDPKPRSFSDTTEVLPI